MSGKSRKLESIDSLLKRIRKTGTIIIILSGNQAAADRVQRVAVKDLVLVQKDKPKSLKRHRSAREISHETAILRSSVHRIIHRDLQLNQSDASNDVVFSCCLK